MSPQAPKTSSNSKTWFILGREALLSAAEIAAIFDLKKVDLKDKSPILKIPTTVEEKTIKQLGGTIKIGEEIGNDLNETELKEKMEAELLKFTNKVDFGISFYGGKKDRKMGINLKTKLKQGGRSVRVVDSQDGVLNAAQIKYNKLIGKGVEFLVEFENGKYNLARTTAVQDVDEFSERDFGRPTRDDFSGMLPPKLAMMMINLAKAKKDDLILDPFCGSGTILSEAILLGYKNLIGSDISPKAMADTKKNIEWTNQHCCDIKEDKKASIKLFTLDAALLNSEIPAKSINAIITEPYLGKPLRGDESEVEITRQAQELKRLYLSAFKEFAKILKPKGIIIFIVPRFRSKNDWIEIDIRDEIKELGFWAENLLPQHEALLYARPNQKVGREIWKFSLK